MINYTELKGNDLDKFVHDTMSNQPVLNIGTIGHVMDGKSTLVKSVSGVLTQRYASEKVRNITIRLGYANAKIWKCPNCFVPECYQSTSSTEFSYNCKHCSENCELVRHVSFTDCPGHNLFMSTMLNGTCVMDYTILVESCGNDIIPAPQTLEHYGITKKAGISPKVVCLNKVDLFSKSRQKAQDTINKLRTFFEKNGDTPAIIPISATLNMNIDVLLEQIANFPIPRKDLTENFKMLIIRSFNINTPDTNLKHLKGGVVGGSLVKGILKNDQQVIIYPGYILKKTDRDSGINWTYKPFKCKVLSIKSDDNVLQYAISGGLIGVQLDIDPGMTGDDRLIGQVMFRECHTGEQINVFEGLKIKYTKIDNSINIKENDILHANINSNNVKCIVFKSNDDEIFLDMEKPVCVQIGDFVTLNVPLGQDGIHIFAHGTVIDGISCELNMIQ